jgi:hypothetical protein
MTFTNIIMTPKSRSKETQINYYIMHYGIDINQNSIKKRDNSVLQLNKYLQRSIVGSRDDFGKNVKFVFLWLRFKFLSRNSVIRFQSQNC